MSAMAAHSYCPSDVHPASSAVDLARWDAALAAGKLLERTTLAPMWIGAKLNNGSPAVIGWDDAGRAATLDSHYAGICAFRRPWLRTSA